MSRAEVKFDGGRHTVPEPIAAYACVVTHYSDAGDPVVVREAQCIGDQTVNIAEYMGMLRGVMLAIQRFRADEVEIFGDSQLVINHLTGDWKCRSDSLRPLLTSAQRMLYSNCDRWNALWIPREKNAEADMLVNRAMDQASA